MRYENEYRKAVNDYARIASKANQGDASAKLDKADAFQAVRAIERAAARDGVILERHTQTNRRTGEVTIAGVSSKPADKKRDLQLAYANKFDDQTEVMLPDPGKPMTEAKKTTLRDYHRRRLLGK